MPPVNSSVTSQENLPPKPPTAAVLGGSFNPVHLGHLFLAEAVRFSFGYDRIIFVPAYQSPFKLDISMENAKDRLDMLSAAVAGNPYFTIDDAEIRRKGVSYTIDTLRDLADRYRLGGKIGLILGDDLAENFSKWKDAEDIIRRTDIIIAHRMSPQEMAFPYPHKILNNEILTLSSAHIREQIRRGGSWRYLLPEGTRHIIEDRRLYGYEPPVRDSGVSQELIAEVEHTVRTRVRGSRFSHSRNTASLCWDLCLRFGLDPSAGYLAGIAHDICKSCDDDTMRALAEKDGDPISRQERKKPSLLHARAGAVFLRERFGIQDREILEAVRFHTVGDASMGDLAKVTYIADKIEISREGVAPAIRDLAKTAALDELFEAVLHDAVAYLRSHETDISEGTLRLLEAIHKRNKR
ncbi:MAG: nicotinate (nicotinamide) nucleotide adenylyltransferase [Spirochaetaceae bacterium]|jgi:nicotinate-nucleotide adenylyltransferase|nr:nicotinate (nicotinamide) nucleotide adenylyltransferase [Spirochaetaceae bacterium]